MLLVLSILEIVRAIVHFTLNTNTNEVTVPGKILVNTDIRLGSEGVRLSSDGNGEFGVGYGQTATNSRFTVYNNTTAAFRVLPNGNVGIGTAAPADRLHVALDSSTTNAEVEVMRVEATSSGTPAVGFGPFIDFRGDRINGGPDSYGRLGFEADAMPSTTVDGAFVVQTAEDGNYSERLRIDSSRQRWYRNN